jgi:lauroyl/myristoyl acyltransferase
VDDLGNIGAASRDAAEPGPSPAAAIVHKRRRLGPRPAWRAFDLLIALGLALLLLPSWLLPERSWGPIWRGLARLPVVTNQRAIRRRARDIGQALGLADPSRAAHIARGLKATVYEMRMQDLRAWRPGGWNPKIAIEGEEHLKAALAGGKGAVLWLAPFVFNSGAPKIALSRLGYRVSHLSSPMHGYSDTRFGVAVLNRIRCIPEDRFIAERIVFDKTAPASAMRRMMRVLAAGGIVSIVAANTEGYEMVETPFLGGTLPVAVGAPRLAGLTGAPLLPVFTPRDPERGFRIVIEPPIALTAAAKGDARSIAAAVAFFRRAEPWVRRYPEQWRSWSKWRPHAGGSDRSGPGDGDRAR